MPNKRVNIGVEDPFLHGIFKKATHSLCGIDFSEAESEESDLTEENIDCPVCLDELKTRYSFFKDRK